MCLLLERYAVGPGDPYPLCPCGTFPPDRGNRPHRAAGVIGGGAPGYPNATQRSTRKGHAASVRRQSRQRLRCGCIWERRSKGADAVFAVQAETKFSALCDDEEGGPFNLDNPRRLGIIKIGHHDNGCGPVSVI